MPSKASQPLDTSTESFSYLEWCRVESSLLCSISERRFVMSMSMGHGYSMRPSRTRIQRMSRDQRLLLVLQLRTQILDAVWGDQYGDNFKVEERCSLCEARLTLTQILQGFSQDPNDTLSTCPSCKQRFQPRLIGLRSQSGQAEIAFWCPNQTLAGLKGKAGEPFHSLINTAFGRSALIHFGGLKQAFAKINLQYSHDPRSGWQDRIKPFLGRVTDRTIAEVVGVSPSTVGRIRREMEIPAFTGFSAS
jgi:hypothetical protein